MHVCSDARLQKLDALCAALRALVTVNRVLERGLFQDAVVPLEDAVAELRRKRDARRLVIGDAALAVSSKSRVILAGVAAVPDLRSDSVTHVRDTTHAIMSTALDIAAACVSHLI
jgi:hypothetical protein